MCENITASESDAPTESKSDLHNPVCFDFCGGFTHGMTHGGPHGDAGLKIGHEGMNEIFDFIEDAGDKPFFVWYAPFLPHTPHNPPKRLFDKYAKKTESKFIARYWTMCEWFDETCGELLDHLDEKNLAKTKTNRAKRLAKRLNKLLPEN